MKNAAIRKGHTSFLFFHFWDLKLVPIDSALNSASGNLSHFFQKCKRGTKKSSQICYPVKFCLKCPL